MAFQFESFVADAVLNDTLEHLNQGVSYFSAELQLVACNRRFLTLLDFPDWMGVPGTPAAVFFRHNAERGEYGLGDVDEIVATRIDLARQMQPHRIERERPNGSILLIEGNPICGRGFVTTYSDITDLRKAERHAKDLNLLYRTSNIRFREFAEIGADWFWEMDTHLRYTMITGNVYGPTGCHPKDFIGRTREEAYYALQPDLSHLTSHREQLFPGNQAFRDVEVTWVHSDGAIRHISVSGRPFHDETGEVAGYRGVGRDVTKEKVIERKLIASTLAAEQANQAKSDFLARMSHDLRTPLNAILGFSEVIKDPSLCHTADQARDYADNIIDAGNILQALVNDVLDISKIESNSFSINLAIVDVSALIEKIIRLLSDTVSKKRQNIIHDSGNTARAVTADYTMLQRALTNIIENAVKFTPPGGTITVSVESAATNQIVLIVTDTGPGIPEDLLAKVTEPFVQGMANPLLFREGAGLGLAIARRLVETQHGQFEIRSQAEQGTTVLITLPRASKPIQKVRDSN